MLDQLKDSAQRAGVCDFRAGHGREVHFDFFKVTEDMLEFYFIKMYKIKTGEHSVVLFKYAGEIDVGNKIGDVKERVLQEAIPIDISEQISVYIDSKAGRIELLEKIDMAFTFL